MYKEEHQECVPTGYCLSMLVFHRNVRVLKPWDLYCIYTVSTNVVSTFVALNLYYLTGSNVGPDGIPPEVFKCCDFDDMICLNFCNKVLMQCVKPPR